VTIFDAALITLPTWCVVSNMKTAFHPILLLLASGAVACGSLSSKTDEPSTVAMVRGELQNPRSLATRGDLRVAIVWTAPSIAFDSTAQVVVRSGADATEDLSTKHTAEDVAISPIFPSNFALELKTLPPAVSFWETYPDFKAVLGTVVAYEDKNRNGKLDLVERDATEFVDRIIAVSRQELVYIEGVMPPPEAFPYPGTDGSRPKVGFNWQTLGQCPNRGRVNTSCDTFFRLWTPIEAGLTMSVQDDPQASRLMCRATNDYIDSADAFFNPDIRVHPAGEYPPQFPAVDEPHVSCGYGPAIDPAFQRSYIKYTDCTVPDPAPCGSGFVRCTTQDVYTLAPGAAPPPGWPCIVD
jgi:hypothetical protein